MRGDHTIDVDFGRGHTTQAFDGQLQHLRPTVLEQPGGIPQFETDADPVGLDIDGLHAAGAEWILVQIRIGVLAKDSLHRCAIDCAHEQLPKKTE